MPDLYQVEAEFATKVLQWTRVEKHDGTWRGYPPGEANPRPVPLYMAEEDLPVLYGILIRRFGSFAVPPETSDEMGVVAKVAGVEARGATTRLALLTAALLAVDQPYGRPPGEQGIR